ncbi:hypothetical protein ACS5PU_18410 [Pedobacter sp. GSP4]|uniref:hypothetical protein n=1 Tax=Pedobacter sp. GSP4 TaxID=3453716 RepID=UPI003EEA17BA
MNPFFRRLLILVLLSSAMAEARAQHDFIITLENDTINGSVKAGLLSEYVIRSNDGKSISFSPKTVKGYYVSEKKQKFISGSVPGRDQKYFLQVLAEGKINLYEQKVKTPEGVWIITWFAVKGNGEWTDVITDRLFAKIKARKTVFSDLIADNPGLNQSFQEEKKYDFDIVRKYVTNYNNQ